jgi:hypothetical protein
MRKTITVLASVALAAGALLGTSVQTAPERPKMYVDTVQDWQEDNLPVELYLWAECNKGPCDLHREKGTFEGRINCWTARNETSMTMCPKQGRDKKPYVTYS